MDERGAKAYRRLLILEWFTDNTPGMYPGDYFESARSIYRKLVRHGYAEVLEPHNQIYKTRVIITDKGRAYLEARRD